MKAILPISTASVKKLYADKRNFNLANTCIVCRERNMLAAWMVCCSEKD
jgi:hypothetical protein